MPYFNATYASNVDKIFATMGPYIVKCNATTGARESFTKLAATAIYGDMPIVYHPGVGKLFVGSGNTPIKQITNAYVADPPVYKSLYQVDPTTMTVTDTGILTGINNGFGPTDGLRGGPYFLLVDGIYVYFLYQFNNDFQEWGRIEATSPYAYNGGDGFRWRAEQLTLGTVLGTDYVFRLDPRQLQVEYLLRTGVQPNGGFVGSTSISPHTPQGIVNATFDSKNYIVCGDDNLLRQESLTNLDFTVFNLSAVIGPTAPPDPCRIRCLSDGFLYMPCMTANGVIKWNPSSESGVWFGGFEGPIDVMETGSKIFVVQNSPIGLRELV